jgi:hypothetical protein
MSIYWESSYTGKKHIIGSTPYFLEGLNYIRNTKPGFVYNPYKSDYVVRDGPAYNAYRLADLYSMAEKVSFDLSENCTRLYVRYPIGISKKMDTLKFVQHLQTYDNKYKIYTFDDTFYEKIAGCVDNKTSLRALEIKEYLLSLKNLALKVGSQVNMSACAKKLRENKICTKQDLEKFRDDPLMYKKVSECLEYILVRGIDIGCREFKTVSKNNFEPVTPIHMNRAKPITQDFERLSSSEPIPMNRAKSIPEELEIVSEPIPMPKFPPSQYTRKMDDDQTINIVPDEPPMMPSPIPEEPVEFIIPEPVAERTRLPSPMNTMQVQINDDEPEPEQPEEMDIPPFPTISTVSTPIPSSRGKRFPQVEEEIKLPDIEPELKSPRKRKDKRPSPIQFTNEIRIPEPEEYIPEPEDEEYISEPEPQREKARECPSAEVDIPDGCDNYEMLYSQMKSRLAEFSNPGCRKDAREKQVAARGWYNSCKEPAKIVDADCPSNDIQVPKSCDNWEDFYERNKLVFNPETNPGCRDEANRKDLALAEWRNNCKVSKTDIKPKDVVGNDMIARALAKRRAAMDDEPDDW